MEEMVDHWLSVYGGESIIKKYSDGSLLKELPPSDYQMGN